jgi:nickel/cobalt exporter
MSWDIYVTSYRWLVDLQRELNTSVATALHSIADTGHIPIMLVILGLTLGSLHALTPGHGKSVVMAYFLGRRARYGNGLAMASKIAAAHTLSAVLLVLVFGGAVTLLGRPSGAAESLQTASYALIAVIGAWYLYRALRGNAQTATEPHGHLLPYAIGILPCPLTMLVVGSAMAQGAMIAGLLLAVVMGAGAASTIALVGFAAIALRRAVVGRLEPANDWVLIGLRILEIASSAAILLIGSLFFLARI